MNGLIASSDIARIAPYHVIEYLIEGVVKKESMSLGIMLNVDEENPVRSKGTGKWFIVGPYEKYCLLLREWPDEAVSARCTHHLQDRFDYVKKRVLSNPNYKGEIYWCFGGGTREFLVPILDKESNTFIGVIFGGQKRPREPNRKTKERLKTFIGKKENKSLQLIPFSKLYKNFLKLEQRTEKELEEMKSRCEKIAGEIAQSFTFFGQVKKEHLEGNILRETFNKTNRVLINARDSSIFWNSIDDILSQFQKWLRFDWGMVLQRKDSKNGQEIFEIKHVVGRGVGPKEVLLGRQFGFPYTAKLREFQQNPEFLAQDIYAIVSGQPEYCWGPLVATDDFFLGAIVFGSAPEHPSTGYDQIHVQRQRENFKEIIGIIGTKYSEINALERERQKSTELGESEAQLKQAVELFRDMYIALTHQMKRPLVTIAGALSNVRDLYDKDPGRRKDMLEHIRAGLLAADHAQFLTRGCMKIFALERDVRSRINPVWIEAKSELKKLCHAMQTISDLSNRKHLRFSYFEENQDLGIKIKMDKDSFLYVIYNLIDNAIKFADPDTKISFICAQEELGEPYVFKIKSVGLPITFSDEEEVFKKFGRGRNAWRHDESGIGVGCWAAREHMRLHGGDVRLIVKDKLSIFIIHPGRETNYETYDIQGG